MRLASLTRALAGAVLALPLLGAAPAAQAAPEPAAAGAATVRVLRYDASGAAEFLGVVDRGAQIWNASVTGVRLEPGRPADFTVTADGGWPRAQVTGLGRGRIWMGRQAVREGHDPTRIAAHEIGHILGLPDRRTGRCRDLMSGASAGAGCTNPYPNAREAGEVERTFEGARSPAVRLLADVVPAARGAAVRWSVR
jgi:snapalysin